MKGMRKVHMSVLSLAKYQPVLFPKALCGRHADVKRRWTKITKLAVKSGDWNVAMENEEFCQLEQLPGYLICRGPNPLAQGENVLLFEVNDILRDVTLKASGNDQEAWYRMFRDMKVRGLELQWFVFCMLAGGRQLPSCDSYDTEHEALDKRFLTAILDQWKVICRFNNRLSSDVSAGWPEWGLTVLSLCNHLGLPESVISRIRMVRCDRVESLVRESLDTLNG